MTRVSLQSVVGGGYAEFWNTRRTYVVCKGSRASKKSKTTALWHIAHIMKYPKANALVVRKVERTLRDSAYSDLRWAIHRLGVDEWWDCLTSPLELRYRPTGQRILFRGMDDPLKLASISVPVGVLNFLWVEEAYEIPKESDFDTLDESIRGVLPPGYFKRVTITFNPWNERHWLKNRFFDHTDDNVLAMTTDYRCNEWLSPTDLELFETMKKRNPRRYQVAGLGDWGVTEGLVFENWKEEAFDPDILKTCKTAFGMDFGFSQDPTAFIAAWIDPKQRRVYVWDEMYGKGMSNRAIYEKITEMGYSRARITCDSAEPKSIDELRAYGLKARGARKGRDSIMHGIQFLQDCEIIVHPRCVNFLTEISNYTWRKDRFGRTLPEPIDDFNHGIDGLRYGCEEHIASHAKWLY